MIMAPRPTMITKMTSPRVSRSSPSIISTDPGLTARQRRALEIYTAMTRGHSWLGETAEADNEGHCGAEFESVDDYISTFPPDVQTVLQGA